MDFERWGVGRHLVVASDSGIRWKGHGEGKRDTSLFVSRCCTDAFPFAYKSTFFIAS